MPTQEKVMACILFSSVIGQEGNYLWNNLASQRSQMGWGFPAGLSSQGSPRTKGRAKGLWATEKMRAPPWHTVAVSADSQTFWFGDSNWLPWTIYIISYSLSANISEIPDSLGHPWYKTLNPINKIWSEIFEEYISKSKINEI